MSEQIAERRKQLLDLHKEVAKLNYINLFKKNGKKGLAYFKERQLSKEIIKSFGLGFSYMSGNDMHDYLVKKGFSDEVINQSGIVVYEEGRGWKNKFWNRVMFPITNINGDVIGFGGRVMDDSKPKYLNSPETLIFDKSSNLYALDKASKSERPYFILCEGYMDVISLHKAGFDCALAALGTAYTQNHAKILKRFTNYVYLSFDSDGPGISAALRAIGHCNEAGLECKIINMLPYKDPDEFIKNLGKDEFEKRIEQAETSYEFLLRINKQKALNDEGTLDDKLGLYSQIASLAMNLKENNKINEEIENLSDR